MFIDMVGSANAYQPPLVTNQATRQSAGGLPMHAQEADKTSVAHTAKAVQDAVDQANRHMASQSASLRFDVSQESGITVVKMVDTQTNRVLLQLPNGQMLRIAQNLDKTQGLTVEKQA